MFTISATRANFTHVERQSTHFDVTKVCEMMMVYLGMYTGCTVVVQTPHIIAIVSVVAEGRFAARWVMVGSSLWSLGGIPPETVAIVYSKTQILEWCTNILIVGTAIDHRSTRDDAKPIDCLHTPSTSEICMGRSKILSSSAAGVV